MMVTRLAWMASRLVSVNKDTCTPRNELSLSICAHTAAISGTGLKCSLLSTRSSPSNDEHSQVVMCNHGSQLHHRSQAGLQPCVHLNSRWSPRSADDASILETPSWRGNAPGMLLRPLEGPGGHCAGSCTRHYWCP